MMTRRRVYFDWAAAAPFAPVLPDAEFSLKDSAYYGNPSSAHAEGRAARNALEDARRRVAAILNVPPGTLYWTSGGSESNAIPFFSLLAANSGNNRRGERRIDCLTTAIEHPSILKNCETLANLGFSVKYIRPGADGRVSPETLAKALKNESLPPRLVSIQAVNNETGAIHDLQRLVDAHPQALPHPADAAKPYAKHIAVHFHSDCVQALGKIPFSLNGIDSASFSAHKLGGPRGIGLLYLKKPLEALIKGGGQEQGIRPGTENVAGAVEFARCIELFARPGTLRRNYAAAQTLMTRLIDGLLSIERCRIVPEARTAPANDGTDAAGSAATQFYSPYILAASFRGLPGEVMTRLLDDAGFSVSTGSACSTGAKKKQTLAAMGLDDTTAYETIRISQGFSTTEDEVDALLDALRNICRKW
ncbi:MAG: cysteine desulfurase [Spirochaetaceae bacterium]|jgi:cysteine desulfurase|nr:cysteine desulfurase [Spirochaetaceae bacterium]